jgi:hypothetical protein
MKKNILVLSAILIAGSIFMFGFKNVNDVKPRKHIMMETFGGQIKITKGDINIEIHKIKENDIIKETRNTLDKLENDGYEMVSSTWNPTGAGEMIYVLRSK